MTPQPRLARRWQRVAGLFVAVGAVSGTVLSFEMGLLWPGLMGRFGDVIGLPFAIEGLSFLIEAIFLGICLYGWDRIPPLKSWTFSGSSSLHSTAPRPVRRGFDFAASVFLGSDATKAEADGRHRESVVASRHLVDADGRATDALPRGLRVRHRPPVSAVVQPAITLRARLR
jgi:hypothetical protein